MRFHLNESAPQAAVHAGLVVGVAAIILSVASFLGACQQSRVQSTVEPVRTADMDSPKQQLIDSTTQGDRQKARSALLADLAGRYKGIDTSIHGVGAVKHDVAFAKLMREWSPIHFEPEDLKAIAGTPSSETAEEVVYHFDNGIDSSTWKFKVRGKTILGVEFVPGE